jgi:hypothetical protein
MWLPNLVVDAVEREVRIAYVAREVASYWNQRRDRAFTIGEDGTAQIGLKMHLSITNALRLVGTLRELGVFGADE